LILFSPKAGNFSSERLSQTAVYPAVDEEKPGHTAAQEDHFPGDATDIPLRKNFAVRQVHAEETLVDHPMEPGVGEFTDTMCGLTVKMG